MSESTCDRCGKTNLHKDGVHTCSPNRAWLSKENDELKILNKQLDLEYRQMATDWNVAREIVKKQKAKITKLQDALKRAALAIEIRTTTGCSDIADELRALANSEEE